MVSMKVAKIVLRTKNTSVKSLVKLWKSNRFEQAVTIPKEIPETERVIRTIKQDLIWFRDWFTLQHWVKDYNEDFPYSAIAYQTPVQFEHYFLT